MVKHFTVLYEKSIYYQHSLGTEKIKLATAQDAPTAHLIANALNTIESMRGIQGLLDQMKKIGKLEN